MHISRRSTSGLVLAVLLVGVGVGGTRGASAASDDRIPGTYIVDLKPGVDPHRFAKSMARQYGGRSTFVYDHVVGGFAFKGSADAAGQIAHDRRVTRVDQDHVVSLADTPPDLSHLKRDKVPAAYNAGFQGADIKIAIIDTGVDRNHPVFVSHLNVRDGYGGCVGADAEDENGHGTASASNAAGQIGVAHLAKIVPVRVFAGTSGSTSWGSVICGLNWVAAQNEANPGNPNNIDIVNMSLTGTGTPELEDAVARLIADKIVVVAAAGNNGGAAQQPASYPDVIAASALDGGNNIASFSSKEGDMAAPGLDIYSANNDNDYLERTGTSRSAPQVAGAAAIILGENPAFRPLDVFTILRITGFCPNKKINGTRAACSNKGTWGNDNSQTEPRINAYCAGYYAANGVLDPVKCPL